jgi:GNAT superfamily N-acetyltransferase
MNKNITFRPIAPEDQNFLFKLYASTRKEEVAQTGWTDFEQENFLRQQFLAQHQFYTEQFSNAEFKIILADNKAIGRLYMDYRDDEIRVIDISLLPGFRNKGIGSGLLSDILSRAKKLNKPVRIHVERYNPALKLYNRLGFVRIGDTGVYYLMEWKP